jgi:hypothetical protein
MGTLSVAPGVLMKKVSCSSRAGCCTRQEPAGDLNLDMSKDAAVDIKSNIFRGRERNGSPHCVHAPPQSAGGWRCRQRSAHLLGLEERIEIPEGRLDVLVRFHLLEPHFQENLPEHAADL